MTNEDEIVSKKHESRGPNRRVVALVYNGLCTFEFGIVAEVFGLERQEIDEEWYSFRSVAAERGTLAAAGGIEVRPTGSRRDLARAGTVVIPGWRGKDTPVPSALCRSLQQAHDRGARIVSVCSGAYVLAAAGLLDGRRATTHWRYVDDLSEKYPRVKMAPDQLYVEDGNILTSAGSSAGIDVCLHIVRSDYGAEIANLVARRLVMHAHRQGGQSQFISQPVPVDYEADRLSGTIDFVRKHLDQAHSVASLATRARMSPRTFQRRFVALTGLSVGRWLVQERVNRACTLLEASDTPLAAVAAAVGTSSVANLQYHFRKTLGVSPSQYRKRFSDVAMD